jgi:uncharacterized membrane protein
MDLPQIVLRVIHIGAAIMWVGSSAFLHFFIEPTVNELGPQGGSFMKHMVEKRKVPVVIAISAALTVAAGIILYLRDSDGLNVDWITTAPGLALTIGGISAILAFVLGVGFVRPRVIRLGELGGAMASGQPTQQQVQEMGTLQGKLHAMSVVNLVLLSIAVIAMASARYL